MKVKFFKIIVLLVPLLCNAVPHGKEHDYMLLALPRSGSTFLYQVFDKTFPNLHCKNEFFAFVPGLDKNEEQIPKKMFSQEIEYSLLKQAYVNKWLIENGNFAKEVYLPFQIDFFNDYFSIFVLYRHRKYTFPTKAKKLFCDFYESFLRANFKNNFFKDIQDFLVDNVSNDIEKQCAIHTIAYYQILSKSIDYGLNIIDFEKMINLSKVDLADYLQQRIPEKIFSQQLVKNIITMRISEKAFLSNKIKKYQALGVEPFCVKLISYMKQLDPDMQYWDLFE